MIVSLALNKKPEARYQEGNRFAADLRAVLATLVVSDDPRAAVKNALADAAKTAAQPKPAAQPIKAAPSSPAPKPVDSNANSPLGKWENTVAFEKTVEMRPDANGNDDKK
jgi:serine/threonine-protein kinase